MTLFFNIMEGAKNIPEGGGQPLDKKWEGKVGILLFWSFTWVNMTVYSLYPPAYMGYRLYIR